MFDFINSQNKMPVSTIRVLMIVANPCINDSRVQKTANTLAKINYEICILCKSESGNSETEYINNIKYLRVPMELRFMLQGRSKNQHSRKKSICFKAIGFLVFTLTYILTIFIFLTHRLIQSSLVYTRPFLTNLFLKCKISAEMINRILDYEYRSISDATNIIINLAKKIILKLIKFAGRQIIGQSGCYVIDISSFEDIDVKLKKFKPHIIHAHDLSTFPESIRISNLTGSKIIYDSHELESQRIGLKPFGRLLVYLMEKKYIKHTSTVITVCESISDYLEKKYKIKKPIVIMNAPEVNEYSNIGETLRDTLNLSYEVPLAVYVGKITIGRGLTKLVYAMQYYSEMHVALLGPSVASVEDKLLIEAVRLGVRDRLHVVPSVSPDFVMSYIKSADIGVIPIQDVCLSYRFCMPNKLFEMAFSGIPACVSNLPEMKAFIERESVGITMDQTDPKDIARAMRELYQRKDEFIVDEKQRNRLFETYSWETQAEKLKNVYKNILSDITFPV